MPYIPPQHRRHLDPLIDQLADGSVQEADTMGQEAAFAGLLNYACTRLALKIIRLRFAGCATGSSPSSPAPLKISPMNSIAASRPLRRPADCGQR